MTKFYSSASNVRRAIKTVVTRTGITPESEAVNQVTTEEGVKAFVGHLVFAPGTDASAFSDFEVRVIEATKPQEPAVEAAKAPRAPKVAHVAESGVEKPVALVHRVATEMAEANPQVTRKEILTKLRELGVATHTAATQYARWKGKQALK